MELDFISKAKQVDSLEALQKWRAEVKAAKQERNIFPLVRAADMVLTNRAWFVEILEPTTKGLAQLAIEQWKTKFPINEELMDYTAPTEQERRAGQYYDE